jgi:hypothetical protein
MVALPGNANVECRLCGIKSVDPVYKLLSQTAGTYAMPSSVNSLMGARRDRSPGSQPDLSSIPVSVRVVPVEPS